MSSSPCQCIRWESSMPIPRKLSTIAEWIFTQRIMQLPRLFVVHFQKLINSVIIAVHRLDYLRACEMERIFGLFSYSNLLVFDFISFSLNSLMICLLVKAFSGRQIEAGLCIPRYPVPFISPLPNDHSNFQAICLVCDGDFEKQTKGHIRERCVIHLV